jgi:hypothetical protein
MRASPTFLSPTKKSVFLRPKKCDAPEGASGGFFAGSSGPLAQAMFGAVRQVASAGLVLLEWQGALSQSLPGLSSGEGFGGERGEACGPGSSRGRSCEEGD